MQNDNCVGHIPFTLFPTPFPKKLYRECLDLQPIINELLFNIAKDNQFMESSLSSIVQVDEFTNDLLAINKQVLKEGLAQPILSCISRSDYLLDKYYSHKFRARQVEVNAIASGMSAHSFGLESLHGYLMKKYDIHPKPIGSTKMAQNQSLELVAEGLIDAYDAYHKQGSYILMVVEERSLNFSDHVNIELMIHKLRPDVKVVRKRFFDLTSDCEIIKLGPNRELILDNAKEIGVVYFRYCYDPSNYLLGEKSWSTRLTIERSRAIKCPSINFHLSGCKKFQQVLSNQLELERFLDAEDSKRLSNVFCKFWPVNSDGGYNLGLTEPERLVLKPQREGGGHNIFGSDITDFLKQLSNEEDRARYILMEYIDSPLEKNWLLLRQDEPDEFLNSLINNRHHQLVSELGIYGSILGEGSIIRSNKSAGYLVRSKKFGVKEGGVASGYAGISSLMLYDDARNDSNLLMYYDE